jgi:hypothetical protein
MEILNKNIIFEINKDDFFGFPANGVITSDNHLVMGKGAALDFRKVLPGIDKQLGVKLMLNYQRSPCKYGICYINNIFAFQTKMHFQGFSDLSLIKFSLERLCILMSLHSEKKFHMPIPGIGLGGLKKAEVLNLLHSVVPTECQNRLILYEKGK